MVRVSSVNPLLGSVSPAASNSLNNPFARPRPRSRPTSEATTPTTNASTITELRTWRREAPIVRSVANSRVRCAIVMESELAITNAPTKSATRPNPSRIFWRTDRKSVVSLASLEACAVPVFTCVSFGRISLHLGDELLRRDAGLRGDADLVELADLVEEALRRREVEAGERRPADRGHGAVARDPRDPERLDRSPRLHADRLADLEVLLPGRRLVDDELVWPGPRALHEGQRVELRLRRIDAEADVRRAAEDDRLPVLADQVGIALNAAERCGDVRESLHLGE